MKTHMILESSASTLLADVESNVRQDSDKKLWKSSVISYCLFLGFCLPTVWHSNADLIFMLCKMVSNIWTMFTLHDWGLSLFFVSWAFSNVYSLLGFWSHLPLNVFISWLVPLSTVSLRKLKAGGEYRLRENSCRFLGKRKYPSFPFLKSLLLRLSYDFIFHWK